jgi:hypothetical protein
VNLISSHSLRWLHSFIHNQWLRPATLDNIYVIYLFTDCNAAELDQEGASRWSSSEMSKRASPVALITSPCRPEKYCKSSSKHLHALENLLVVRYRSADRLDLMLTRQFYVFLCEPKLRYMLHEERNIFFILIIIFCCCCSLSLPLHTFSIHALIHTLIHNLSRTSISSYK